MNKILRSFERRSAYFSEESAWSSNEQLNSLISEILLGSLSGHSPPKVLDYGAGNGKVAEQLSKRGAVVDVADISDSMLQRCRVARYRYNVTRDIIDERYDGIVLRQVLQYIDEQEWKDFLSQLLGYLKPDGALLFSQIVPYCQVDYGFWRSLVAIRRKERKSFPTENEFFPLLDQIGAKPFGFLRSATRQYLFAWIEHEGPPLQTEVRKVIEGRSAAVNAIWDFKHDDDLSWRNNWIHVLVMPPS